MIARPILFSEPMVRAILEGRKTQTRRICKARTQYQADIIAGAVMEDMVGKDDGTHEGLAWQRFGCPYGQPGDRLWVRETWAPGDKMVFGTEKEDPETVLFRADLSALHWDGEAMATPLDTYAFNWKVVRWKPSIHMPRWASRITLEVLAVRVERLQDISAADALAEGAPEWAYDPVQGDRYPARAPGLERHWYMQLWESINGAGSWDANPWVWVVEFKRMEGEAAGDCLQLATRAVVNLLRNGALCPNDTDGDGDCGRPACPVCGKGGAA